MDEKELQALLDALQATGLASDQQRLLQMQYEQAQKLRNTQQPGLIESRGMLVPSSPLAHIAAAMQQAQGGQQANAIMGQRPQDPRTGQPISMYGNLATSMAGNRALVQHQMTQDQQIREAILNHLRSLQNQKAKVPTLLNPESSNLPAFGTE